MIILGIETSCDETAVSIVEAEGELGSLDFKLLGSAVNSQIEIHKPYGGVFPTLAKREHQKNLLPVLIESLRKANLISNFQFSNFNGFSNFEEFLNKIEKPKIDLIAVTVGPGLEPALWVGIEFAKKLGEEWSVPVIGANHMEGHIASVLFNKTDEIPNSKFQIPNEKQKMNFPAIALLVSGGHTELVLLNSWTEIEKIGETKDDAVGEAFDKVARMLGLPYPGGPEISKLAEEARTKNINLEKKFPRPMIHSKDFNFSFSGLKTAVLYDLNDLTPNPSPCEGEGKGKKRVRVFPPLIKGRVAEKPGGVSREVQLAVAREFEDAVIETLIFKTKKAIEEVSKGAFWDRGGLKAPFDTPKTLIIGGGVIANKALRENFLKLKENYPKMDILIPEKTLTTDNATMIAAAGFIEYKREKSPDRELKAQGNLSLS